MRIHPSRLSTTYAPMALLHTPFVVRLEMTTGRVKPAATETASLNTPHPSAGSRTGVCGIILSSVITN